MLQQMIVLADHLKSPVQYLDYHYPYTYWDSNLWYALQ